MAVTQTGGAFGVEGESVEYRGIGGRLILVRFDVKARHTNSAHQKAPNGKVTGMNYSRYYARRFFTRDTVWIDRRDLGAGWIEVTDEPAPEPAPEKKAPTKKASAK